MLNSKESAITVISQEAPLEPREAFKLFSSFSLLCEILPFVGKSQKWKYLLLLLTKNGESLWKKYEFAFTQLQRKTKWTDHPEELEEIFQDVYGYKPVINRDFMLRICADDDMDLEFLEKAKDYKFPNFRSLDIENLGSCDNLGIISKFLCNSYPNYINELKLSCFPENKDITDVLLVCKVII
ncbi:unnamed protein product [Moneuplotes crassus]|uniref:Uncharacterized protein n=1 Tax=Euplotes crassus TaxID=5936 RepID=A0AAD1XMR2_EUPCR|nr:unnamed protein product [Moneuplotes crassus]